jgi:hypothetical protein
MSWLPDSSCFKNSSFEAALRVEGLAAELGLVMTLSVGLGLGSIIGALGLLCAVQAASE